MSKGNIGSLFFLSLLFLIFFYRYFGGLTSYGWSPLFNMFTIFFFCFSFLISIFLVKISIRMYRLELVRKDRMYVLNLILIIVHLVGEILKPFRLGFRLFLNFNFGVLITFLIFSVLFGQVRILVFFAVFLFYLYEFFVIVVQGIIFLSLSKRYLEECLP